MTIQDQKDLKKINLFGKIKLKDNLTPGNYIFQFIVMDKLTDEKTQIATQWIDFEITSK